MQSPLSQQAAVTPFIYDLTDAWVSHEAEVAYATIDPADKMLRPEDVADKLGVSKGYIYDTFQHEVPPIKLGPPPPVEKQDKRPIRWHPWQIEAYLDGRLREAMAKWSAVQPETQTRAAKRRAQRHATSR